MTEGQRYRRLAYRVAAEAIRDALRPPSRLTVSEWADAERVLPETSAEPGPWRTNRTPYLREIMDVASDPMVTQIVFMKAAQIGGSEALNNILGYFIDQDPSTILLVLPSNKEATKYSKERIAPMLESSPALADKVAPAKSRDSDNTIDAKAYPGGHLGIVGANAPVGLRSRPRRVLLMDEVDGYPASAGTEGDPRSLARKRQTTFGWRAVEGEFSTPTLKDFSPIEADFDRCDERRHYHVPCPFCDTLQILTWERLKWPKRKVKAGHRETAGEVVKGLTAHTVRDAAYKCESCGRLIPERFKAKMIRDQIAGGSARWIPEEAHPAPSRIGFHLNALYSPWLPWSSMAEEFVRASSDKLELQVFVNTRLAQTWDEAGNAVAAGPLMKRREPYDEDPLPAGVLLLTCGVDVQANRLEAEVVGWGMDSESWSIGYYVIPGDPTGSAPWLDLDRLLMRSFRHPAGPSIRIGATCVDAGYLTQSVKNYARDRGGSRVWASKGFDGFGRPIMDRPKLNTKGRVPLYPIGVDNAKRVVYAQLSILPPDGWNGTDPVPGYCHFPERERYDVEHFRQLTAEKIVTRRTSAGRPEPRWIRKHGRRAEVLDCRVYALAAKEGVFASGVRMDVLRDQIHGKSRPVKRRRGVRSKGVA